MAYFIMIDDPKIEGNAAITKSREIMNGNKGKLFGIYLSFFPQILLGIITFGIYFYWLIPTMLLAKYEFYLDITGKNAEVVEAEIVSEEPKSASKAEETEKETEEEANEE